MKSQAGSATAESERNPEQQPPERHYNNAVLHKVSEAWTYAMAAYNPRWGYQAACSCALLLAAPLWVSGLTSWHVMYWQGRAVVGASPRAAAGLSQHMR